MAGRNRRHPEGMRASSLGQAKRSPRFMMHPFPRPGGARATGPPEIITDYSASCASAPPGRGREGRQDPRVSPRWERVFTRGYLHSPLRGDPAAGYAVAGAFFFSTPGSVRVSKKSPEADNWPVRTEISTSEKGETRTKDLIQIESQSQDGNGCRR